MSKPLVAYFSARGHTAAVAQRLAETIGADIYEIVPEIPYSEADLEYRDKTSRSSVEMGNPDFRPPMAGVFEHMADYDLLFVGFPIWWYRAPTIINTFLEGCDLTGKTIVPFATSGTTGMGLTNAGLRHSCRGSRLLEGKRFQYQVTGDELLAWVKELEL